VIIVASIESMRQSGIAKPPRRCANSIACACSDSPSPVMISGRG
jgi:hypothetical protein